MNDIEEDRESNGTSSQKEDVQPDQNPPDQGAQAQVYPDQNEAPPVQPKEPLCTNVAKGLGFINRFFDGILYKVRGLQLGECFSIGSKWAVCIGSAAFVALGAVAVLAAVVLGIRADSVAMALLGILVASPACLVFSYIGSKLFDGITKLIENFPSRFSSRAFLDCVAAANLFFAAASVVIAIVWGVAARSWGALAIGLILAVTCAFMGIMALSPKTVNSEIGGECSPAEELIGIVSFKIKALLLTAPFIWCVGAVAIVVGLLLAMFKGDYQGASSMALVGIILGLLPIYVYVLFLAFVFCIDVLRAILSIPSKLDALRKQLR